MAYKYDWEDVISRFEVHLAVGGSVEAFCAGRGNPNKQTLYLRIRENEDFERRYERAIKFRALEYADKVHAVVEAIERGDMDEKRGRVMIQGLTHMMDRYYNKMFGDKSKQIEVKVDLKEALEAARKRALLEPPTIEGQVLPEVMERARERVSDGD